LKRFVVAARSSIRFRRHDVTLFFTLFIFMRRKLRKRLDLKLTTVSGDHEDDDGEEEEEEESEEETRNFHLKLQFSSPKRFASLPLGN